MRLFQGLLLIGLVGAGCKTSSKSTTDKDSAIYAPPNGRHSWTGAMKLCTTTGIELDLWTEPSGASRVDLDIYSHDDAWTETHAVPLEYADIDKDEDHWFIPLSFTSDDAEAEPGSTTEATCIGGFSAHFATMFSVYDSDGNLALCHIDGDDTTPFDALGCHEGWE